jgi:2-polyprenyl-3-methyl-5-hydroxy-6-metoxy-1,4-benzoquinol methylase
MKPEKDVLDAIYETKRVFPFKGYMDNKLNKYTSIIYKIRNNFSPGSEILSIGAGPWDLEAILSKLGYSITAIDDLNDQWHLIGNNRERIKDFAKLSGINLIEYSACSADIKVDSFDAVLLIDIIEHMHNSPRQILNYSITSLKPGGLLMITTPNVASLSKRLRFLVGKSAQVPVDFLYWNIGEFRSHFREYTKSELLRILQYQNLISINAYMLNIALEDMSCKGIMGNIILQSYGIISNIIPNFRDTILICGKKPDGWEPTAPSIANFANEYKHLIIYNIDDESSENLLNKLS